MLFFRYFKRCDVIVALYYIKVKCLPIVRYQNKRLTTIQSVACCGFAAEQSKVVFILNGGGAQDARDIE